ncbi:hypothetical protein C8A03DRAFT_31359 [Achaetomium macrosporum]|uniref:Protein kinase domain-containing protein n=1 Tax=Achaetomium macrosporum TaxID=79813 RepID=A0AAN7HD65_9PEZI|nr:hypothetical protein C8A03DRAFT_31359 [Achaetomium macrosporum]
MSSTISRAVSISTPYTKGVELRILSHIAPKPFGGVYRPGIRPAIDAWVGDVPEEHVALALDYPPLETSTPGQEEHTFTITATKSLRHLGTGHGGPHVVTGYIDGDEDAVYLAKIYDGVCYPLKDEWNDDLDCMTLADRDYAVEAAAYECLQSAATVWAAKLVPEWFGCWTFSIDTHQPGRRRWVRMLLLELVEGETILKKIMRATEGDIVQYSMLPPEDFRLRVLRDFIEAQITIWWDAEILHEDLHARNVIVRDDGSVVVINFNQAVVHRFKEHRNHPKYEEGADKLPKSPIERRWPFAPAGTLAKFATSDELGGPWGGWLLQGWFEDEELVAAWLLDTWECPLPGKYRPLSDYFLNHPGHAKRSQMILTRLERLGRRRRPTEK